MTCAWAFWPGDFCLPPPPLLDTRREAMTTAAMTAAAPASSQGRLRRHRSRRLTPDRGPAGLTAGGTPAQ